MSTAVEAAPPLLELRQYLLRRGRRDELIELFDREFVESQEACGIRVLGHFRDVDRINHFVWLRGFPDPSARAHSLSSFYCGPVWKRFRDAANPTMIDSDDVLQLRAHDDQRPLIVDIVGRRDDARERGVAVVLVSHRPSDRADEHDALVLPLFEQLAAASGLTQRGTYETDPAPNGFPALPVRRANCLVWLATSSDDDALERVAEELVTIRSDLSATCREHRMDEIQLDARRLVPTARSTFRATT